jgi:hypothetical protein
VLPLQPVKKVSSVFLKRQLKLKIWFSAIQKELEEEQQKGKDCWDQLDMHKERVSHSGGSRISVDGQTDLWYAQYTLRGVCFYAGWIARSSMFCYVKGSQGDWWKVCDTAVEPVSTSK